MTRKHVAIVPAAVFVLALVLFFFRQRRPIPKAASPAVASVERQIQPSPAPSAVLEIPSATKVVPAPLPAQSPAPTPAPTPVPAVAPAPAPEPPTPAVVAQKPPSPAQAKPVIGPPIPPPPVVDLHKELIPKDIQIARCYYGQEVAAPGSTVGFDIDGSGFNSEFEKIIRVDPGAEGIQVKNLHMVTADQIHGELEIGPDAKTKFIYPKVLIGGLAVFGATEPLGIVRPDEVLFIKLFGVPGNGRAMRFHVLTNIGGNAFAQFQVESAPPGLDISPLSPQYPFAVDGTLKMSDNVVLGSYGLKVSLFSREIYRLDNVIRILKPNIGRGSARTIEALDRFRRPGDTIQFYLTGIDLEKKDASALLGRAEGIELGAAVFSYKSPTKILFSFPIPSSAPEGSYGVTVEDAKSEGLKVEEKDAFTIVPTLWLRGVSVDPAARAGHRSRLTIAGRELTAEFAQSLQIFSDAPGIGIANVHFIDSSDIGADLSVSSAVPPGDYWLHLSAQGAPLKPQFGSLIKVSAP